MRRRRTPAATIIATLALACAVATPDLQAEPSRFLPWKDARTPPLALHDLGGRPQALADYRGKVVLINFWATWCEPCRDEMPSMQKLQERLAGRPFAILAVNHGESEPRVKEFVERASIGFRILLDPNQEAPRAWRVRVLPASFLIGTDGRVRYSVIGELDWASDVAVNTVRGLLP